ncbi:unnamed protein product [Chrysodeixis includens]|uniref:Arrestin C-terminal-like domain-containing protein n=1 Tax=Chrysodeixis includens TaxID=689277 RepID=A0A9P0BTA9_CHRIL|nr:unnamed protein product [Chrysodeixis includens]
MICSITLNSDSIGNFYAGDVVTGVVVLDLKNDQKLESIDFKVSGVCKANWSRSAPTIPYIKIYSEKKKVLSILIPNIFKDSFKGDLMPAGIHTYPFHFALPADLPSTFESSIAKVAYYIKIKSKPSYKLRKAVPFTVLGNVNLNHVDEILMPTFYDFSKTFRKSGSFRICFKTYKGFAPRQTIPFEITVVNEKKVKIRKIVVTLIQKLRYNVKEGYAEEERKMCYVEHKNFSRNVAELCFFNMEIPQLIPSSLNTVDPMIDVSYIFRVEVIFPFHLSLLGDVPVTVATTPVIHYEFD